MWKVNKILQYMNYFLHLKYVLNVVPIIKYIRKKNEYEFKLL